MIGFGGALSDIYIFVGPFEAFKCSRMVPSQTRGLNIVFKQRSIDNRYISCKFLKTPNKEKNDE